MKPIICFGEALIDLLNIGTTKDDFMLLNEFRQYPGGAPANVAVSIAKLGGNSIFIGQVGNDSFGDFLKESLQQYRVDITNLQTHSTAKTALAFILLDEDNDRSFSFYRHQTADVLFDSIQIQSDWFNLASSFHFCSNTLTTNLISETTQVALTEAKKNKLLISFDVNLRHDLWPKSHAEIEKVKHFLAQADLVKFSKEELFYLSYGNDNITSFINEFIDKGVSLIIVTDGANNINYYTKFFEGIITPPKVKAIDTTAGGDSFCGGLLFALNQFSHPLTSIQDQNSLEKMIEFASHCGAFAVSQNGAYPSMPYFKDVAKYWSFN